jgi:hypothetical protein
VSVGAEDVQLRRSEARRRDHLVVEQGWGDQWNTMRREGTSYYLSQILAGTTPVAGDLLPSGTWAWNLDLFATEPRLISTDPQTAEFVLRPDAVCSDGVAISVAHFRFNWFHNSGRADQHRPDAPRDGSTSWAKFEWSDR